MKLHEKISSWILDYLKINNLKTLVIGISGGIDSAVTSTLCAMTGFPTKLLVMPIYQNEDETKRGLNHCSFLKEKYNNVEIIKTDLSKVYDNYVSIIPKDFHNIWAKGIESNDYFLKLCGSGGGGYILGFSKDFKKAKSVLKDYKLEIVYNF